MGDLAASDITLTKIVKHRVGLLKQRIYQLDWTTGKTYPANGVPLPALSYFDLQRADFWDLKPITIDGLTYKYDKVNHSVRIFQTAAQSHAHDLLIKGGQAGSTTNDVAVYATAILGKEEATDATIAGADAATKGGVKSQTLGAAALVELGNVAVGTTSLLLKLEEKS